MSSLKLDKHDRKILAALQKDGRLANIDLSQQINLSPSSCLRRVRRLEDTGLIKGYTAIIDNEKAGLGLTLFVNVKVERHRDKEAKEFREAVAALPEVTMAYLVSGESDFLLHVVVPDLRGYERFLTETLLKLPGVTDIRSNFAIQTIKSPSPLPLDHIPG